jgi:hypothetical protein
MGAEPHLQGIRNVESRAYGHWLYHGSTILRDVERPLEVGANQQSSIPGWKVKQQLRIQVGIEDSNHGRRRSKLRVKGAAKLPTAIGLMGTLLIHALVLRTVLSGGRPHSAKPPDAQGPGATLVKSAAPAESLILIEMPTGDAESKPMFEDLASAGAAPKSLVVTILSADPLPHVEIPPDSDDHPFAPTQSREIGDPAARALLFGRYTGQIQARIERAWRRPRSPVTEGVPTDGADQSDGATANTVADTGFRCEVRIIQDANGTVQEVQMLNCNGSVSWQHSLVGAIFAASPLPSPPSPTVFTPSLVMLFSGQSYSSAASPDDYEMEPASATTALSNSR